MRIYVDTNVYLDYLLGRRNRRGEDLGERAAEIFTQAVACRHWIVLSDHVLNELYRSITPGEAETLWATLGKKVVPVRATEEDISRARLLPTHVADALHVVLARKGGARIVVTRNVADFRDLVEAKRPEDV